MTIDLKRQTSSIVVLGPFNPAMFQPLWFAETALIRREEASDAQIEVVSRAITIFRAKWLEIRVDENRFQAKTDQENFFPLLRDVVTGVLQTLNPVSLTALGINRQFAFEMDSESSWHALGHSLAPKANWNDLLIKPGMALLQMQGKRPDDADGYLQVQLQPSRSESDYLVTIEVNDHYVIHKEDQPDIGTNKAVAILDKNWQESIERSKDIAHKIVATGENS